mmetsp:Transcript_92493/g.261607  ORF Transcript_92493/g.261607 Transcript_92493/m.261607 type:complete len:438 (-) Transcript_92493:3-1316(-)
MPVLRHVVFGETCGRVDPLLGIPKAAHEFVQEGPHGDQGGGQERLLEIEYTLRQRLPREERHDLVREMVARMREDIIPRPVIQRDHFLGKPRHELVVRDERVPHLNHWQLGAYLRRLEGLRLGVVREGLPEGLGARRLAAEDRSAAPVLAVVYKHSCMASLHRFAHEDLAPLLGETLGHVVQQHLHGSFFPTEHIRHHLPQVDHPVAFKVCGVENVVPDALQSVDIIITAVCTVVHILQHLFQLLFGDFPVAVLVPGLELPDHVVQLLRVLLQGRIDVFPPRPHVQPTPRLVCAEHKCGKLFVGDIAIIGHVHLREKSVAAMIDQFLFFLAELADLAAGDFLPDLPKFRSVQHAVFTTILLKLRLQVCQQRPDLGMMYLPLRGEFQTLARVERVAATRKHPGIGGPAPASPSSYPQPAVARRGRARLTHQVPRAKTA